MKTETINPTNHVLFICKHQDDTVQHGWISYDGLKEFNKATQKVSSEPKTSNQTFIQKIEPEILPLLCQFFLCPRNQQHKSAYKEYINIDTPTNLHPPPLPHTYKQRESKNKYQFNNQHSCKDVPSHIIRLAPTLIYFTINSTK